MSDNDENYSSPLWRPAENDPFLIMYRRDNRSRATQMDDEAGGSIDQSNVPSTSTSNNMNGRRKTGLPQELARFKDRTAEGLKPKPVGSRLQEEDENDFENRQAIPSTSNDNRTDSRTTGDDGEDADEIENGRTKPKKWDRFRNRSGKRSRTTGDEDEQEHDFEKEKEENADAENSPPISSRKKSRLTTVRVEQLLELSAGAQQMLEIISDQEIRTGEAFVGPGVSRDGTRRNMDFLDELETAGYIEFDDDTWAIELLVRIEEKKEGDDDRRLSISSIEFEDVSDDERARGGGDGEESIDNNTMNSPIVSIPGLISPINSPVIAIAADHIEEDDERENMAEGRESNDEEDDGDADDEDAADRQGAAVEAEGAAPQANANNNNADQVLHHFYEIVDMVAKVPDEIVNEIVPVANPNPPAQAEFVNVEDDQNRGDLIGDEDDDEEAADPPQANIDDQPAPAAAAAPVAIANNNNNNNLQQQERVFKHFSCNVDGCYMAEHVFGKKHHRSQHEMSIHGLACRLRTNDFVAFIEPQKDRLRNDGFLIYEVYCDGVENREFVDRKKVRWRFFAFCGPEAQTTQRLAQLNVQLAADQLAARQPLHPIELVMQKFDRNRSKEAMLDFVRQAQEQNGDP